MINAMQFDIPFFLQGHTSMLHVAVWIQVDWRALWAYCWIRKARNSADSWKQAYKLQHEANHDQHVGIDSAIGGFWRVCVRWKIINFVSIYSPSILKRESIRRQGPTANLQDDLLLLTLLFASALACLSKPLTYPTQYGSLARSISYSQVSCDLVKIKGEGAITGTISSKLPLQRLSGMSPSPPGHLLLWSNGTITYKSSICDLRQAARWPLPFFTMPLAQISDCMHMLHNWTQLSDSKRTHFAFRTIFRGRINVYEQTRSQFSWLVCHSNVAAREFGSQTNLQMVRKPLEFLSRGIKWW